MISRAIAAGVPFAWFTADEAYGQAKYLQAWLEGQDVSYVMAIRCSDTLTMPDGEQRADALIAAAPSRAWQRLSTGAGAHGPREFDWTRIAVCTRPRPGRGHWLLARRSLSDPAEIAYYACYGPRRSSTADLAWIAGSRWHIGGVLPAGQGRGGAGSLPGPVLAGLVRPHHLVDARPGLARGEQGPGSKIRGRNQRPRHDRLHAARDPQAPHQPDPAVRTRSRGRLVLVPLASATPVPGPAVPLQAIRLPTHLNAVAHQGVTFVDTPGLTRKLPSSPEEPAMRMRSHRRSLTERSADAAPASRSADQQPTRLARSGRIRWTLRAGVLLTVIGVMRLARIIRARWRPVFLLTGAMLIVIGVVLPSLPAFLVGPLVVLFAMPKGPGSSNDGCWIPFVGRWPPS